MLRTGLTGMLLSALLILSGLSGAAAQERYITVASTTSTANSGLFDHLLPQFTTATGIEVRIVAVGTGQAVRIARNGDADVLFVHHTPSEEAFVADGLGIQRFDVMYNDFVVIGPLEDRAEILSAEDALDALKRISAAEAPFASRGDDSGTHKREQALWDAAGLTPTSGFWYRETGAGMGATLNTAHAMGAYALTDRATWLAFRNKEGFDILFEGDDRLFNQYGIVAVNPAKFAHVKAEDAQIFVDWVLSEVGQAAIAGYMLDGTQLFFPNAAP